MRRTVIALLLAVGAAAAVARPAKQNPSAQAPQKGHCAVGVVSRLGDKIRVHQAGVLGKASEVPVESWHLDDLVVDRIRGALGRRAAVQRISYRKEVSFPSFKPGWFRVPDYAAEFRDAILVLAPGTRCARYVLVTEGEEQLGDGGWLAGVGINKDFFGIFAMYAVIRVLVVDGETFKLLSDRTGSNLKGSFGGISFWLDPPNNVAQDTKVRGTMRELVARELDAMLPKLPLTP